MTKIPLQDVYEIDRRKEIECYSLPIYQCQIQCLVIISFNMLALSLLWISQSQPPTSSLLLSNPKGSYIGTPFFTLTSCPLYLDTCYHMLLSTRHSFTSPLICDQRGYINIQGQDKIKMAPTSIKEDVLFWFCQTKVCEPFYDLDDVKE